MVRMDPEPWRRRLVEAFFEHMSAIALVALVIGGLYFSSLEDAPEDEGHEPPTVEFEREWGR